MIRNKKQAILYGAILFIIFYFVNKFSLAVRLSPGEGFAEKFLHIGEGLTASFENILVSFNGTDLLVGLAGAAILLLAVLVKRSSSKKYRQGIEYGSARWGSPSDIRPFINPSFTDNILLTKTERLTMDARPKDLKYARNKNVLVIGGSGSGKTRFFVEPNIMQMHSSYVVTDPKGTIIGDVGSMLQRGGYLIRIFNTVNFSKSMHYNPFAYIHGEKDILKFVNVLMLNTKGEGDKSGEDFWVKAERLLYCALVGYIYYEALEEEKNFTTLLDLLSASQVKEDDEDYKSKMDFVIEDLKAVDPDHFAVRQYEKFKMAAGKTAKSILISCGARLAPFDIRELREITEYDEL
ncbi:MAG: type IV secretory system conjugative DNA transfer family protein, partial [Lachnospiraceae bacterium]|nr:type IV secretory system conjugative DNA transfer family protein [Lachnospiraceae bacterium]